MEAFNPTETGHRGSASEITSFIPELRGLKIGASALSSVT
jgi:hypothetical protein